MNTYRIIEGEVLDGLAQIESESVQCCVTSPPYWGLRDYGEDDQIGLEKTPEEFVERLVGVFREVRRVLRDDGVLFLNLGDSYAQSGAGQTGRNDSGRKREGHGTGSGMIDGSDRTIIERNHGCKPKDLVGIPWMVAFALRADGWYLRSDIIWHKPNPMPESVTDRPTKAHEYIFLLSKGSRYYWDADAAKEPSVDKSSYKPRTERSADKREGDKFFATKVGNHAAGKTYPERNIRTVWSITTKPYSGAHFATFPPEIPERCIKAGSKPGDLVLDPFAGSGTTLSAALRLGRNAVGCELNSDYAELAHKRIESEAGAMFVTRA